MFMTLRGMRSIRSSVREKPLPADGQPDPNEGDLFARLGFQIFSRQLGLALSRGESEHAPDSIGPILMTKT